MREQDVPAVVSHQSPHTSDEDRQLAARIGTSGQANVRPRTTSGNDENSSASNINIIAGSSVNNNDSSNRPNRNHAALLAEEADARVLNYKERYNIRGVTVHDTSMINGNFRRYFLEIRVPGDGSCFYHCVRQKLGLQSLEIRDIRNVVADHISNNRSRYENFVPDIEVYIEGVRSGEWADNIVVAAAQRIWRATFVIYNEQGISRFFSPDTDYGSFTTQAEPIYLVYYDQNQGYEHYNILEKI
jgi:hypothetical protein